MADSQGPHNTALPPRTLRHSPPEIIDVDSLPDDDHEIVLVGHRLVGRPLLQAAHRQPVAGPSNLSRIIHVIDSDDEDSAPAQRPPGVQRHRLFSPPPPVVHRPIPPVPPIPRQFARNPSARHPGEPPPVIVPSADPLPFEAQLPRDGSELPVLPPRGAPRSHHNPVMGLGGALIALNRQTAIQEEHRRRALEHQARHHRLLNFSALAGAMRGFIGMHEPFPAAEYHTFGDFVEPDWAINHEEAWLPEGLRHPYGSGSRKSASQEPSWRPSYTHPDLPEDGFSFDFEPKPAKKPPERTIIVLDDDDIPSSSNASTAPVLVCGRCLDPLCSSGQEGLVLSADDSRNLRVWALRCGHMLDGKCINAIMRPQPPVSLVEEVSSGEAQAPTDDRITKGGKDPVDVQPAGRRNKGKGRAAHSASFDKDKDADPALAVEPDVVFTSPQEASAPVLEENGIRSRLRPRPSRTAPSSPPTILTPAGPVSSRPVRPLPRQRGEAAASSRAASTTRPKGKGRARKPVIEERHAWICPVSGCCREHLSVRLRGEEEWKMDDNLGAIALFV